MTGPQRPLRPIAWWVVLTGAAAVVAATFVATAWLLAEADKALPAARAGLRIDAIRTGLSVGAGTGGAIALLIAVRRQWLSERAQAHQETVAEFSDRDAAERRITELYFKAADQLGSDKAPVRLAGLYALERLAQDNPAHRQTVVNVICAYLRMPYTLTDGTDPIENGSDPREEYQVRLTAQSILARHLGAALAHGSRRSLQHAELWEGIRLELSGATLIDFDLTDATIGEADFYHAIFTATKSNNTFRGATFKGVANFACACFLTGAYFDRTVFEDDVYFGDTSFLSDRGFPDGADFKLATFLASVRFESAKPPDKIDLSGARAKTGSLQRWPTGWTVEADGHEGMDRLVREDQSEKSPPPGRSKSREETSE